MRTTISRWASSAFFLISLLISLFASNGADNSHNFLMATFCVFLVGVLTQGDWALEKRTVPQTLGMCAVPVAMVVLTAMASSQYLSVFESRIFAYLFGTAILVGGLPRHRVRDIWSGMAVVAIGLAAWGLYDFFVAKTFAHASFGDPNLYGALMLSASCLFAGVAMPSLRKFSAKSGCLVAASVLCASAGWAAHSRSAWLALAVGGGMALVMSRKALGVSNRRVAAIVSLVVLLGAGATLSKTINDVHRAGGMGESITSRIAMTKSTWSMVKDSPLTGLGWGAWNIDYPKYRLAEDTDSAGNRAHNDYLEAFACGGVFGLFLVLSIPVLVYRGIRKIRAAPEISVGVTLGLSAAGLTLASQALINFVYHQSASCLFIGLLIGSMFALGRPVSGQVPAKPVNSFVRTVAALLIPFSICVGLVDYLCSLPGKVLSAPVLDPNAPETLVLDERILKSLNLVAPLSVSPGLALGVLTETKASITADIGKKKALYDRSLAYFDAAYARDKTQTLFLYRKALIWREYPGLTLADKLAKIEPLGKAALAQNPAYEPILAIYGAALVQNLRGEEALANVDRALSHVDKNTRVHLQRMRGELAQYNATRNGGKK